MKAQTGYLHRVSSETVSCDTSWTRHVRQNHQSLFAHGRPGSSTGLVLEMEFFPAVNGVAHSISLPTSRRPDMPESTVKRDVKSHVIHPFIPPNIHFREGKQCHKLYGNFRSQSVNEVQTPQERLLGIHIFFKDKSSLFTSAKGTNGMFGLGEI